MSKLKKKNKGNRKLNYQLNKNIMNTENQNFESNTLSGQGGVILRVLRKKRDFYLWSWLFHIVFFPFF
jgi:hypothetical protein